MSPGILAGAAAGAAGTTALNALTYLDMSVRGRPSSDSPERLVEAVEARTPLSVPGAAETRRNRLGGLGALAGIATGIGVGAAFGALRRAGVHPPPAVEAALIGLAAMAATDLSMAALGVSDPRTWQPADWAADLLPHLGYGAVTAATLSALDGRGR
ncbi:hypothetical protein Sru01_49730 [Sphaerisporangium rufum]|uniref:DUF1440 domain-containing protein n=1 Tax=Sphaerisporangium rufum TaxID=1381558 RepID=A0A919V0E5_9ACTN|nr:hypothetical protein [Sphaerisporangium rufum]GII79991.1 hypothetical protein Sru01_49730 [Sphaerisporangium rufum]